MSEATLTETRTSPSAGTRVAGDAAVLRHWRRRTRLRRAHAAGTLAALAALAAAAFIVSIAQGAVPIRLGVLLEILGGRRTGFEADVLVQMRLPRALLVGIVGAGLAIGGAGLQGLFRNPLADPALIGVSTGAALAVVGVLSLQHRLALPAELALHVMPAAAFCGACAATILVYRIATADGHTDMATMLLAGVALNAVAGAGIGLFVFLSDDQQLRDLQFWLLGSFGGATWTKALCALLLVALPAAALLPLAASLDAFALGETEATHLGFDVERAKRLVFLLVALAVGASVALAGVVAFVGLVVPHLVRLCAGPGHRLLLPAAALLGAALLLAADLLARLLVLPAELPIGVVTSLLGGPFFLWLLIRRRVAIDW